MTTTRIEVKATLHEKSKKNWNISKTEFISSLCSRCWQWKSESERCSKQFGWMMKSVKSWWKWIPNLNNHELRKNVSTFKIKMKTIHRWRIKKGNKNFLLLFFRIISISVAAPKEYLGSWFTDWNAFIF